MVEEHTLNLQPGTVIAGRYEIVKCLGSGSMGLVYATRDRELPGRIVAIKALYSEVSSDEVSVARFRNEIIASYGVSHPNVIRSYELIKDGDIIAYTMEYVEGGVLLDYINSKDRIDINKALRMLIEMCSGVQAIHDAGIVHRDLKPENILITKDESIKIADFGIARTHHGPKLTEHGSVVGTIDYVSPEYMLESKVDWRSDIYAMGILSYELITGKSPFEADSVYAVMTKRLTTDPAPPSSIRSECPKELDQIILKAMARDIDERYQSANELGADLINLYKGQPLQSLAIEFPPKKVEEYSGPSVDLSSPADKLVDQNSIIETVIKTESADISDTIAPVLNFKAPESASNDNELPDTQVIEPEIIDIASYYTARAEELGKEKIESVLSRGAYVDDYVRGEIKAPSTNSSSISRERISQLKSRAVQRKSSDLPQKILIMAVAIIAIIGGIVGGYYLSELVPISSDTKVADNITQLEKEDISSKESNVVAR